jgi:hypothetical protein
MLPTGDSGRIHPARQRVSSMRSTSHCDNADHRMTAMRNSNLYTYDVDQKCQRCALATRKSRKTWMRATDLSSSG